MIMSRYFIFVAVGAFLFGCKGTTDNGGFNSSIDEVKSANQSVLNTQSTFSEPISMRNRRTINPFTWNILRPQNKTSYYGLVWGFPPPIAKNTTLSLTATSWELQRTGSHYADFEGNQNYLLNYSFLNPEIGNNAEYAGDYATNHRAPGFPEWIAGTASRIVERHNSDGVMLDWWHNNHPTKFSPSQVRSSRIAIAQALRAQLGENKIIMGNVNQNLDHDTARYLNAVFMEAWKPNPRENYTLSELREIERAIRFYEKNLKYPKIIALEGWRVFTTLSDADMNTSENRRSAKLFTALSAVIPTAGYILFADNNADNPRNDHDHLLYDFYDFDIGQPIGNEIIIKSGASFKRFENGFIAFNITGQPVSFVPNDGETIWIEPRSGLFCENKSPTRSCLSFD